MYLTIELLLLLLIGFNFILHVIWRGHKAFIKSRSIFLVSDTPHVQDIIMNIHHSSCMQLLCAIYTDTAVVCDVCRGLGNTEQKPASF